MEKKYYGGALFPNKMKKSEKSPDLSGDIELPPETVKAMVDMLKNGDPIILRASAWLKEGRNGKFYSVSLNPKDSQPKRESQPKRRTDLLDDEIPF